MKNKALLLLKQIVKNKSKEAKIRLVELSLTTKSKKLYLLGNMSNKIHCIVGQQDEEEVGHENTNQSNNTDVMRNEANSSSNILVEKAHQLNDGGAIIENAYPGFEHWIIDDNDGLDDVDQEGSVIDIVKSAKEEGQDFNLEDEIDNVADVFIERFYKQIGMQKLESFKRYQEMLARSV